jgi:hypothetical protein
MRLTDFHRHSRARWAAFLAPLVGAGTQVSVRALDDALATQTGRDGDARGELYAYLKGTQTVRPLRAFYVGEALRSCGVPWASGIVALWAAGHFGPCIVSIGKIAHHKDYRDHAVALGVLAPLAAGITTSLGDEKWGTTATWARQLVARVGGLPDGLEPGPRPGRVTAGDEPLLAAFEVTRAPNLALDVRERLVWSVVIEWSLSAPGVDDAIRDRLLQIPANLQVKRWLALMQAAQARSGSDAGMVDVI